MPFCRNCGKEVPEGSRFCPLCGASQSAPLPVLQVRAEPKDPGLVALIALLAGIFGFWGVGHIYLGKIGRGIALLILGLVLEWGGFAFIFLLFFTATGGIGTTPSQMLVPLSVIGLFVWGLLLIALWAWQTYDAYSLAKYYNAYLRQHGSPPW